VSSQIKSVVFIYVETLIMLMLFSEQAEADPRCPCGRPGAHGHCVGDPWPKSCLNICRTWQVHWIKLLLPFTTVEPSAHRWTKRDHL